MPQRLESKASKRRHRLRWGCRSRCSAALRRHSTKLSDQPKRTAAVVRKQPGPSTLGRLREGRLLSATAPAGGSRAGQDRTGQDWIKTGQDRPTRASFLRALQASEPPRPCRRWHLARRAGWHPTIPGAWIELMAAQPLWHKRAARRSTAAAESCSALTTRPCVAQVSFVHPGLASLVPFPSPSVSCGPRRVSTTCRPSPVALPSLRPSEQSSPTAPARAGSFGLPISVHYCV